MFHVSLCLIPNRGMSSEIDVLNSIFIDSSEKERLTLRSIDITMSEVNLVKTTILKLENQSFIMPHSSGNKVCFLFSPSLLAIHFLSILHMSGEQTCDALVFFLVSVIIEKTICFQDRHQKRKMCSITSRLSRLHLYEKSR